MAFQVSYEYDRQELLDFVGSKQRVSGIIWGEREPGCVILTSGGKHGIKAGYGDRKKSDGSWDYVGQGSKGDQNERKRANAMLIKRKKSAFLFTAREPTSREKKAKGNTRKLYRFEGVYEILGYNVVVATSDKRKGDRLIVFNLIPTANIYTNSLGPVELSIPGETLNSLRRKILAAEAQTPADKVNTYIEYRIRSKQIKAYALLRAQGVCELCAKPAPFTTSKNIPFLEVHHICKLADDGPDIPTNVAAICPNCHREAHFGERKEAIKHNLIELALKREMALE